MQKNKKITIVVLSLLLLSLQSCEQPINKIETYERYRTQQIEPRDSLFVIHTIKEWGIKNWYTFEDYSQMYKMTNNEIEYFLGGTFYSPDKKRILVWVGLKKPNAATIKIYSRNDPENNRLCPNAGKFVYSMTAVIGTRDSINQRWYLYPFDQQQAVCFDNKDEVINVLGQYYFKKMKSHQMYRIMQSGEKKGHKELQAYGYNLQDKDFWSKCWLFEKDTVGSYNLYPFQIKGYDYKGDKCTQKCAEPFNPPSVDYPKEILDKFR